MSDKYISGNCLGEYYFVKLSPSLSLGGKDHHTTTAWLFVHRNYYLFPIFFTQHFLGDNSNAHIGRT